MNINKPIKRIETLKFLSREHHQALLLCWKIRTALQKQIETSRIKIYANWFYHTHLLPHFEMEEKYIFSILGVENELIKKAITEHRRLKRLFEDENDILKSLSLIEEELERHIRFEERVVFNAIQEKATEEQLVLIQEIHSEEKFVDNLTDPFWVK